MDQEKINNDVLGIEAPFSVKLPTGKTYELKKFSIAIDVRLKNQFGTREKWEELFSKFDGEAIIYALWLLLGEKGKADFRDWKELCEVVPADLLSKSQMAAAVSMQLNRAIPGVPEMIGEALKKAEAQVPKILQQHVEKQAETSQ